MVLTYAPRLINIVANDEHTVGILHVTARHAGKTLDQPYAFVCRIANGQVTELWEMWHEGAAWEEFWS